MMILRKRLPVGQSLPLHIGRVQTQVETMLLSLYLPNGNLVGHMRFLLLLCLFRIRIIMTVKSWMKNKEVSPVNSIE